jgi:hypothetical protein
VWQPKQHARTRIIFNFLGHLVISLFSGYTLSLSMTVFAIGGSSHIRQLAGEAGLPLWELWKNSWPILLLVNPISILLAVIAVYLPPSSRKNRDWMWLRFFVLLGAVISICLTIGKLPNAYAAADFWK